MHSQCNRYCIFATRGPGAAYKRPDCLVLSPCLRSVSPKDCSLLVFLTLSPCIGINTFLLYFPSGTPRERKKESERDSNVQLKNKEGAGSMHTCNRYSCLHKHSRKIIQVHCAGISEDIYIYYIGVCKRASKFGNSNRARSDNF